MVAQPAGHDRKEAAPSQGLSVVWLVGAQIGRLVGFIVLSIGLAGTIPMSFAGPAGWGDGITGVFAPIVAFMLYRRVPGAMLAALIWNAWGLGDLVNVARLASLT